LRNELGDKRSRLRTLQDQERRLGDELQRLDAWKVLWRVEMTRYGQPIPELQQLKAENSELQELSPDIVQEVYEESRSRVEVAFSFIRNHEMLIKSTDGSFRKWISKHGLSLEGVDRDLASQAFQHVAETRRAEAEEQARKASPLGNLIPSLSRPPAVLGLPAGDTVAKQDPREKIQQERRGLAAQQEVLGSDVVHLEERLAAFRYPPNIWWGLGVLAYLAIGGVMFPLALLPADTPDKGLKWLALFLFCSGIVALFCYIGAQILSLQRREGHD